MTIFIDWNYFHFIRNNMSFKGHVVHIGKMSWGYSQLPLFYLTPVSSVHWSSDLRRRQRHGDGLSEPSTATHRHLSPRQRWGVPGQPARPLGSGHRHPEGAAAGPPTHTQHFHTVKRRLKPDSCRRVSPVCRCVWRDWRVTSSLTSGATAPTTPCLWWRSPTRDPGRCCRRFSLSDRALVLRSCESCGGVCGVFHRVSSFSIISSRFSD